MNLSFNGKGATQLDALPAQLPKQCGCSGQPPKSKIDGWEAVVP